MRDIDRSGTQVAIDPRPVRRLALHVLVLFRGLADLDPTAALRRDAGRDAGTHQHLVRAVEIGDLDEALGDVNGAAAAVDADREMRALHRGDQIGRLHLEMPVRHLVDPEHQGPDLLEDRRQHAVGRGLHLEAAVGRDRNGLVAPRQKNPAVVAGPDRLADSNLLALGQRLPGLGGRPQLRFTADRSDRPGCRSVSSGGALDDADLARQEDQDGHEKDL